MKLMKGSLVGLVLAGILALAPTAAFAHGGGGGGHGGGGGGHGGGFGGGHGGGFGGGGGHFAGGGGPISLVAVAISLVEVVILLGLRGIVLPAIASQNTKERTLRGTKIISGTTAISFLEVPLGTEIPIRMIIRTTAIMITMTATIMMGNSHQPK